MLRNIFIKSPLFIFRNSKKHVKSVVPTVTIPKDIKFENEPVLNYEKGSTERCNLEKELKRMVCNTENIPIVIAGKEYQSDCELFQVMPFEHSQTIAKYYHATPCHIENAIKLSAEYQQIWDRTSFEERAQIWQNAADLMAGKYRQQLNAATMLGQGKTVIQSEIDAAAELIDFFRSNSYFFSKLLQYKPISTNSKETLNSIRYRGLEGFVAAITPFNFTALSGNMAYTPVLAGNSVVWKPSDTAILSNWIIFKILLEAGLPPEIVNFVPSDPLLFSKIVTTSPYLAGINYCGTTSVFKELWKNVSNNIKTYFNFPVLSGECGGKNFHFVHPSANVKTVVACTIRSAFEYSGQKCSSCSRMFVPESLWDDIRCGLIKAQKELKVGDPRDFSVFTSAVIDEKAFKKITNLIKEAEENPQVEIIAGGNSNSCFGYYVEPTIIEVSCPDDKLMTQEIFGPILAIYVYPDSEIQTVVDIIKLAPYALTGSVFAQDSAFLKYSLEDFKMSAGNFYINDKSTGAIVGQQPFGGRRMSGTNEKAGGPFYILRWMDMQSIKETFIEQSDIEYSCMKETGKCNSESSKSQESPKLKKQNSVEQKRIDSKIQKCLDLQRKLDLKKQKSLDLIEKKRLNLKEHKRLDLKEQKRLGLKEQKHQQKHVDLKERSSASHLEESVCPSTEIREHVFPSKECFPERNENKCSPKMKDVCAPKMKEMCTNAKHMFPADIKEEICPPELEREICPPQVDKEIFPPEVQKEIRPPELKEEISPPELKEEISPPELKEEISPPELKEEISPPELKEEICLNKCTEIRGHIFPNEKCPSELKKEKCFSDLEKENFSPKLKKQNSFPKLRIKIENCSSKLTNVKYS